MEINILFYFIGLVSLLVTGKKYLKMEYLKILNIMKKIKENKSVLVDVT
jgi:hypothetical protein